jgi:hypothetical protein
VSWRLEAGEPAAWVVKGGMVLEWRLGGRARATRDLDLVRRGQAVAGPELRERLVDILAADPEDDRFTFEIGPPQALDVGFRFSLTANLAGKVFASVRLDVAARSDELLATETLQVPGALPDFDRLPPPQVEVASPAQHFAEKLHALTREHGDRPNTRMRDLVDLLLLIELDLVRAPEVLQVVRHVFESRVLRVLVLNAGAGECDAKVPCSDRTVAAGPDAPSCAVDVAGRAVSPGFASSMRP